MNESQSKSKNPSLSMMSITMKNVESRLVSVVHCKTTCQTLYLLFHLLIVRLIDLKTQLNEDFLM